MFLKGPRTMSRLFCALAAAGFVAAAIVHGRTFIPGTSTGAAAFLLHLGAFAVFIPAIFAMRGVCHVVPAIWLGNHLRLLRQSLASGWADPTSLSITDKGLAFLWAEYCGSLHGRESV